MLEIKKIPKNGKKKKTSKRVILEILSDKMLIILEIHNVEFILFYLSFFRYALVLYCSCVKCNRSYLQYNIHFSVIVSPLSHQ